MAPMQASRHPWLAFRIYSHGVRIRMLVEMNTGYQCGDAYRACWSWTRRKNRPSPPPDAGDAGARQQESRRSTAPTTAGLLAFIVLKFNLYGLNIKHARVL